MEAGQTEPTTALDSEGAVQSVLLARQPIYNQAMGVYAYELLFHSNKPGAEYIDEDEATAQMLANTLTMDLDNLVGSRLVAMSISEWYLYKAESLPVPQEQVILIVPSTIEVAPELTTVLESLKRLGFTLALDCQGVRKDLLQVFPLLDMLRFDTAGVDKKILRKLVKQYRKHSNLSLLSANVESLDAFRYCCDIGFDYCQGNLLSKPRVYKSTSLASSKVSVMHLLSMLYRTDVDFDEIEKIVERDVTISYKLLKLINSAFIGLPRQVDSIKQAVVLLGRDQLKSWISMLVLNSVSDSPVALMEVAIVRAKMCELIARAAKQGESDSYFTVGLFSALDVLMKQPLDKLISNLPLSDDIKTAILQRQGDMGSALKCAIAYENSDWTQANFRDVSSKAISKLGYNAFVWGSKVVGSL